jgi:ATP-binding cassette, subfamily C, bacterial LapB
LATFIPLSRPQAPRSHPAVLARLGQPLRVTARGVAAALQLTSSLRSRQFPGVQHLRMSPAAMVATLLVNAFGLMLPLAVLEVYDAVIPHAAGETLVLLVLGFLVLTCVEAFLRIARAYVTGHGAAQFETRMVNEAIARISSAERGSLDAHQDARHQSRIASISRLSEFYGGQMRWALLDIPFVILYLACMALIAGWLAAVPVFLLAVAVLISANITEPVVAISRRRDNEEAKIYDFIGETLAGVTAVKGAGMEAFMARRFERLLGRSREMGRESILATGQAENLSTLLGSVTLISIGAVGGIMAINGDLSIGSLAACTLLAGRVVQPVMRATGIVRTLNVLSVARDDAAELLALPQQAERKQPASRPGLVVRGLRLTDWSPDLPGIDIDLHFGEALCITSRDSASCSALLKVLAGETRAAAGSVAFGGAPVEGASLAGRGGVVYVSPRSDLFNGTILENLTAFGYGGTLEDVVAVCELLGIREAIDRLPAGFDTLIGERASENLPSGLAQRIAVARALALRPRLIILDEPQALLDTGADRALIEGLSRVRGRISMIIGSQRPSYLALGDRAYSFNDQRLAPLPKPGQRAPAEGGAS